MGLISAAFVAILILSKKNKIDQLSDKLFYFLISGLILSVFILCFGIYASCCGQKCPLITLAILFFIFGASLTICGIFLIVKGNEIVTHCGKIWSDSKYEDTKKTLEEFFECTGFDPKLSGTCYTVIKDYISKYKNYVSIGIFIFAALVFAAMIIACVNSCCLNEDRYSVLYNSFT